MRDAGAASHSVAADDAAASREKINLGSDGGAELTRRDTGLTDGFAPGVPPRVPGRERPERPPRDASLHTSALGLGWSEETPGWTKGWRPRGN